MSVPPRASAWPILALLFNALVWGVSWWPFRHLEARGLNSLWTTAFIYGVGTMLLLAWGFMRRPAESIAADLSANELGGAVSGKAAMNAGKRALANPIVVLVALGLAAGLTNACFNWAVTTGSVVRVVLLFYLMPIWAVLLARWLLSEPITGNALLRIALALLGAITVLWRPELGIPWPQTLPDWLAIIGGAGFALTNVLLRRLQPVPALQRAIAMFVGSGLMSLIAALVLSSQAGGADPLTRWPDWLAVALVMAIVFLLSNLALQYGAAKLPANVTAVVMLSEVLFASLSAIAFGDERLSLPLAVGGGLIVLAAWLAGAESSNSTKRAAMNSTP